MKVILTQDVKKVGKRGAVIDVADGYGAFLLQKGFAKIGSAQAVASAINTVKQKQNSVDAEVDKMMQAYKQLEGREITIPVRVNEKGVLYGQIHALEITEAIQKEYNVMLPPKCIDLKQPLKHTGTFEVPLRVEKVKKVLPVTLKAVGIH